MQLETHERYVPHESFYNNPYSNFERIKDKKLWEEKEDRDRSKQLSVTQPKNGKEISR